MTRVGILAGCLGRDAGGPETYERCLVRAIAQVDQTNEYFVYSFSPRAAEMLGDLPPNVAHRMLRPTNRWISLAASAPWRALRDRVDVLHATLYPPPLCPCAMVFTMHDISPIANPEFFSPAVRRRLQPLVRRALATARAIICVSQNALETTAERLNVPRERMRVVPHGVDPSFRPIPRDEAQQRVVEALGLRPPYILYVGKIMSRKNLVRVVEAYGRFVDRTGSDARLALVGRRLYDNSDLDEAIGRLGLGDRVIEPGHAPERVLPALYSAAEMFVFPTLWEGFGLPALEAMACGTPTIVSNVSSLPEVAGDAALMVDPYDAEQIAEAMVRINEDADLRASMRQRGLEQAGRFSWKHTAERTIDVYANAAK